MSNCFMLVVRIGRRFSIEVDGLSLAIRIGGHEVFIGRRCGVLVS